MWKLKSYLKPYWISSILGPLCMVLEVWMDLLQPIMMASIINDGIMTGDLAHIQKTGLMMLGVALIGAVGGVGCTVFSSIASQNFGRDLRNDLFEKVQTFSFRNLDQIKTGSLITRLTNDVMQIQSFVQMIMRGFIRSPLLFVGSFIMAISISPKLTLVLAIATPLLFILLVVLIRKSFPLFSKVQSKLDAVNNVLQENLSGIRVVKAFVRANYERKRFGKANEEYTHTAIKAARLIAINMPIMTLILNTSVVAVLWYGGGLTRGGSLSTGELIAFINYVTQLLFSMLMISNMLPFVSRAKVSSERINEVLDTLSEITDPSYAQKNGTNAIIHSGHIQFKNVSFAYDTAQTDLVLQDISFQAEPGQTLAILGATGSGKSTLISLIPRLYDTTSGSVLIDGTDVKDIPLDDLRGKIGMALQQSILFTGSIRDNIRFGKNDAGQDEIEAYAKAAEAHDFIMRMPDGYNTILGQKGVNLSGGQKQRISIARALLVRPAILILDDSTSAVDLGTESRIQKALKELMNHTTTIIIAQRISSIIDADQIIVLGDNGTIAAEGTHEELIHSSAIYQDIYRSQRKEEQEHVRIS
ncbi:ABC transporter ATP-binding protein [Paenibacillus antarcticus]|uniref:Multidrug ABC transporter ATP-binding protein n=1 Tax=Paenibacillus antarcticus TaxID=253703 RepID=A0A168QBB8_9BACL|nr:ABC transporter ATP-binding protein [Paenibacillus antarcticus]OAB47593.1 multidrug ABC transporter ATP-binding protein [Paenibacillus antarcticus]